MTASFSPIDGVFLTFAIVSSLVYIYTLFVLIRKRSEPPFNSHFFGLFVSLGVSDLCSAVMEYLMLGIECGWIDWAPIYLHPIFGSIARRFPRSSYFFFGLSQYIGVLTLAANRFYNVEAPLWTAKKQAVALIAQWVIPTAAVLPYMSLDFKLVYNNDSANIVTSSLPAGGFAKKYLMLMQLSQLIIASVVGVLYCRIYAQIRQTKKDFGISQNNQSELKLALMGLILLVLMLAQRSLMVSMIITSIFIAKSVHRVIKQVLLIVFYHLGIVFALINPFLLLGCSVSTRQAVFGFLCPSNRSGGDQQQQQAEQQQQSRPQPFKPRPAVARNNQMPRV